MERDEILLPRRLVPETVADFAFALSKKDRCAQYVLRTPRNVFAEPFGLLVCASVIRQFQLQLSNQGGSLVCDPPPVACYLAHVGFYHHINYGFGKGLGEVKGNRNYFPITRKNTDDFGEPADRDGVIREIDNFAGRLAGFLLHDTACPTKSVVSYIIREICRNVVDHSKASIIWHIGQYYPKSNEIEVAILDEGIGIKSSLSRNPEYRYLTDQEAISKSLKKGVSGRTPKNEEEEFHGAYEIEHNAGLGLYIVSEICKERGSFSIASGQQCFDAIGQRYAWFQSWLSGTAIRLRLDLDSVETLNQQFVRLGVQHVRARSTLRG